MQGVQGDLKLARTRCQYVSVNECESGKEEEMWNSVQILCKEQEDGSLTVEVLVCHPDWEEPQTIAAIHSHPQNSNTAAPSLKCASKATPLCLGEAFFRSLSLSRPPIAVQRKLLRLQLCILSS